MSDPEMWVARGTSLGEPLALHEFRKAPAPQQGDRYGTWNEDVTSYRMPGGSVLTFDLSRLTHQDYRQMRTDYQINASCLILLGMLAQADWYIYTQGQETDTKAKAISDTLEEGLRRYWMSLVRSAYPAIWGGFAPSVLVYELNASSKYYEITNYKDLVPEDTRVDWELTRFQDGTGVYKYSGIINRGKKIPGENTLWYPMLMENGNYYGTKLLKPAFAPWFFSQLIHLYTNRYFERFGEPTAVGYYPADETVKDSNGNTTSAREVMGNVVANLRNRGVVTIPSERDPDNGELEWDIKYLESQMRGADFDRYLARLDEEKSLALFTPVLLFRAGERGSFGLAEIQQKVFMWMLNMMLGDWKSYLDPYVVAPLHDVNFGPNAPRSEIRFRTLGRLSDAGAISTLQALIQNGGAKLTPVGLRDLGGYLGVDLEYLTGAATPDQGGMGGDLGMDPNAPSKPGSGASEQLTSDSPIGRQIDVLLSPQRGASALMQHEGVREQLRNAQGRLNDQVVNIFRRKDGTEREIALSRVKLGYKGAFIAQMQSAGADTALAENFFNSLEGVIRAGITEAHTESDALASIRDAYADYGVA